jgi:hypothetical protein
VPRRLLGKSTAASRNHLESIPRPKVRPSCFTWRRGSRVCTRGWSRREMATWARTSASAEPAYGGRLAVRVLAVGVKVEDGAHDKAGVLAFVPYATTTMRTFRSLRFHLLALAIP